MKKIIASALFVLSSIGISLPVYEMSNSFVVALAEEENNIDKSDIYSDLKKIDLSGYTVDKSADSFDVIQTLEWKYNGRDAYNLYLYVFNKSAMVEGKYNLVYPYNRVEMFVYNDGDNEYQHLPIKFISRTNDNKFIKFKVEISNYKTFLANATSQLRTYTIIGLEIAHYENNVNRLTDYEIGHSWNYEGLNNTTVSYSSDVEYLHITDLKGGVYRTDSADLDSWTAKNDLFYTYFTTPKHFDLETWSLYAMHADYYRFDLSNKIYCLVDEHDADYYQGLIDNIMWTGAYPDSTVASNYRSQYSAFVTYWGGETYDVANETHFIAHAILDPAYDDLFGSDGLKFRYKTAYGVSRWFTDFSYSGGIYTATGGQKNLASGNYYLRQKYSDSALFFPITTATVTVDGATISDSLDLEKAIKITGQTAEQTHREIKVTREDEFDLRQYGDHHNGWDTFWRNVLNGGDWTSQYADYDLNDIPAIETFSVSDATLSDEAFINKYHVSSKDAADIKNLLRNNLLEYGISKDLNIVRFDNDYYDSKALYYGYKGDVYTGDAASPAGHVSTMQTGIIDFDVIDLTFMNAAEELKVIPVVGDPINIIGDADFPTTTVYKNDFDLWALIKKILSIVGIVVLVILIIWLIAKLFDLNTGIKTRKIYREQKRQKKKRK